MPENPSLGTNSSSVGPEIPHILMEPEGSVSRSKNTLFVPVISLISRIYMASHPTF